MLGFLPSTVRFTKVPLYDGRLGQGTGESLVEVAREGGEAETIGNRSLSSNASAEEIQQ